MKSILFKSCALLSILTLAASCNDDMEYVDTEATPVSKIYEPVDGKSVKLVASNSASLLFEWAPSHAGNGAQPQYEVVFTTADGNLDNPLYRVTSDNVGSKPRPQFPTRLFPRFLRRPESKVVRQEQSNGVSLPMPEPTEQSRS